MNEAIELITSIISGWPVWAGVITTVISAAAAVAAVTPTKVDNEILNVILKFLNVIGLNVGKAKNADDVQ